MRVVLDTNVLISAFLLLVMAPGAPPVPVARAGTHTVNSTNDVDDGACDGTHCSLREAVKYATSGDTVEFSVTGTINLTSTLTIASA